MYRLILEILCENIMYRRKSFFKHSFQNFQYHTIFSIRRQEKKCGGICRRRRLLSAEGFAVGALIHCGILLMGTHQNAVQGAVVFGIAVVSALLNGAFDALVCLVHLVFLLLFGFCLSMHEKAKEIREKFSVPCN